MKKLLPFLTTVWLLATALLPLTLRAATDEEIKNAGGQFVDLLAKEDFAAAEARFDSTMQTAMPEDKLRQVWQALLKQAGGFNQQLETRAKTIGQYKAALITCRFAAATLDVKVVYDAQGKVAGLFIIPSQSAIKFSPPPYADTKAFREEDFSVGSGQWRLPGTLTLPAASAKLSPAVVLVHGSGPEDRDETIGANKPFRDLAWGLASKGVAVLRYEKRTKQYPITDWKQGHGHFTVQEETIDDALSAVAQLRLTPGIDPKRIFVLGHSLGGMLAPRIGQADPQIAGLIIMAGSVRPFEEIIVDQTRYILSLAGKASPEGDAYLSEVQANVNKLKKLTSADISSPTILFGAPVAYWLDLRQYDPLATAKQLKSRVLILQGERDYQVTLKDYEIWKSALGSQSGVTFKLYPRLNHLFIPGDGKSAPAEYEQAGHVEEKVVSDIAEWISK
jgi:dienelactone hydrolase